MDYVREVAGGLLLSVRAVPRGKRNEVLGEYNGALKIRLKAPPVDGKANACLLAYLTEWLELSGGDVELVKGESNRDKTVLLRGQKTAVLKEKLKLR